MKLITAKISKSLPPLYSSENEPDPAKIKVIFKLFNPCGAGTWYITEGDLASGQLFGLCVVHEAELGYVDLGELERLRLPFGMKIERDLHWEGSLADAYKAEGLKS